MAGYPKPYIKAVHLQNIRDQHKITTFTDFPFVKALQDKEGISLFKDLTTLMQDIGRSKPIPESKKSPFKRGDFHVLRKNILKKKEIISIIGPRRVGKTIILHQLIQDLLDQKTDPKKILYLSVDEVELNRGGVELKDILEVYSKYVIKTTLDEVKETHFLFLDEIQELPDWEKILKNWYVQEIVVFSFGVGPVFCHDSQCRYNHLGLGRLRRQCRRRAG